MSDGPEDDGPVGKGPVGKGPVDKGPVDRGAVDEVPARPTAMLPRERQMGFGLAAVAAVATVAIGAINGSPLLSGLGLVAAGGLALSTRHGHRVFTAIAAVVAGVAVPFLPIEVLFLLYSFLLMSRTSRAQGKINAARPRLTPQQRRQARDAKRGKPATAVSADGPKPRQPAANRRYTPPKAKPGPRR